MSGGMDATAGATGAGATQPVTAIRDDEVMDTRTPSPVQKPVDGSGAVKDEGEAYKPDLSQEVAMLSTKLVNAINYQTNLDDSLQATRHELERAQQDLGRVRAEKQSLDDAIAQGVLVKKIEVDKTIAALRAELVKEKANRETAEKLKRQTDGELESLTANLFEEANKMVAQARMDTETVEKRNMQLKSQIKDTEDLLASQQEQLQDLKLTMEKLERTDTYSAARDSSLPSTPTNSATAVFDAMYTSSPSAAGATPVQDITPDQPLHFSALIQPVLRTDISAYSDFAELLHWARWARHGANPHSRTASGNNTSTSNNTASAGASQTNLSTLAQTAANNSSPNLPGAFTFSTTSANNSPSSSSTNQFAALTPPLKESKFYKRCLVEDLEPTLRLDLAPGLSFLSRRAVLSALLSGTLSIEPFTPPTKFYSPIYPCAMCGESRKHELYVRRHRFRTSESEDASRYPLCAWCLERVRASAELIGFLRMVREGVWRCENEGEERGAWGEGVRLRERCFWARIGGGVVPAGGQPGSGVGVQKSLPGEEGQVGADGESEGEKGEDDVVVVRNLDSGVQQEAASVQTASSIAHPEVSAAEDSDTGARGRIGRAIVKMVSRAASPAVPGLHATNAQRTTSSEDSAAAHAQLQREQSEADGEVEMKTPPETPSEIEDGTSTANSVPEQGAEKQAVSSADTAAGAVEPSSATMVERARPSTPQTNTMASATEVSSEARPSSRPLSTSTRPTSVTSARTPSPRKSRTEALPQPPTRPSQDERRPSSVLARVRAMEGKGK